jgi:hypothetical protein
MQELRYADVLFVFEFTNVLYIPFSMPEQEISIFSRIIKGFPAKGELVTSLGYYYYT